MGHGIIDHKVCFIDLSNNVLSFYDFMSLTKWPTRRILHCGRQN